MGALRECDKVYVNKEKLQSIAKRNNFTLEDLSIMCGMGCAYFSTRCEAGWIPKYVAESLKKECGIPRKEYEVKNKATRYGNRETTVVEAMGMTVPVDKQKLYAEIKKRGMAINEASVGMGYAKDGISGQVCSRGYIMVDMAEKLQNIYGIEPQDYAPDGLCGSPTPQKDIKESAAADEDAIYRAAYSAIMNTWAFIREDLKTIIKEALSE